MLSVLGAYCLAVFAAKEQKKAQKELIRNFCSDTANNLKAIVDDMVNHRQRTQVIHGDSLALLTLAGDRAIAQLVVIVDIPFKLEGVEVMLSSYTRLLRAERREGVWRLFGFDPFLLG